MNLFLLLRRRSGGCPTPPGRESTGTLRGAVVTIGLLFSVLVSTSLAILAADQAHGNRSIQAVKRPDAGHFAASAAPGVEFAPGQITAADPNQLKPLSPRAAILENAAIPLFRGPVEPSPPFVLSRFRAGEFSAASAIGCLTAAIYYEAASEPVEGQRAVAQVVLNRLRHPAYPKSVCGVVFEGSQLPSGCQFTFACDGSLARTPTLRGWKEAERIARSALAGTVERQVGTATNYHADYVLPYWATSLQKIAMIGHHIFYRFQGNWGGRGALNGVYAGEPIDASGHLVGVSAQLGGAADTGRPTLPPLKLESPSVLLAPSRVPLTNASPSALKADEDLGTPLADGATVVHK